MVTLSLGKKKGTGKVVIFNSTLEHKISKLLGVAHIYDCLNNHMLVRDDITAVRIGRALRLIKEYMDLESEGLLRGQVNLYTDRMNVLLEQIVVEIDSLPTMDMLLEGEFSCDWSTLYEVVTGNLKNAIMELQAKVRKDENSHRELLLRKIRRMEENFGRESEQVSDSIKDLNNHDNIVLKRKADKYKEFILDNNEKPTRAFCLLGKENNLLDDMEQIKDQDNLNFETENDRKEYIRKYYETLYKKKIDNLIGWRTSW